MMRKSKNTGIAPKAEDETLASPRNLRSPYERFEEMDRWFDEVRRNFFGVPGSASFDPGIEEPRRLVRQPLVDLVDEGRDYVVRAELPGVSKENVNLDVAADRIEIRAETSQQREEKAKDYYFRERRYETLERLLPFPAEVRPDEAQATLKDGVLEVRVPKREPTPEQKPVKVRVE